MNKIIQVDRCLDYNDGEEDSALPSEESLFVFYEHHDEDYLDEDEHGDCYQKDISIYVMQDTESPTINPKLPEIL